MVLPSAFAQKLCENRVDGKFVDFSLRCDGNKIDVHKVILSSYSPVFATALSGSFQEKEDGVYEVLDASYQCVSAMVDFMYTGSYNVPTQTQHLADEGSLPISFHARMVSLADKYLIPSLQDFALSRFNISVESETDCTALLRTVPWVYDIDAEGSAQLRRIFVAHIYPFLNEPMMEADTETLLELVFSSFPQFFVDLEIYAGLQMMLL